MVPYSNNQYFNFYLSSGKNLQEKVYGFEIKLFADIDVDESKWNTKGRNIIIVISKKDKEQEYWPRLTEDKSKNAKIQIDWTKYIDEDDEGAEPEKVPGADWDPNMMNQFGGGMPGMGGAGGMDMASLMQQMQGGGMGGMGGMDGMGDSDDEEEEETKKADIGDLD